MDLSGNNHRHIRFADGASTTLLLDFTPDGKTLVTYNSDKTLRFWDLSGNKEILRKDFAKNKRLDSIVLSANASLIAVASNYDGGGIHIWKWQTDKAPRNIKVPNRYLTSLAVSADEKILAVGSYEGLFLLDVASGRMLRRLPYRFVRSMSFSRDGKMLAITIPWSNRRSSLGSKTIALLQPGTGEFLRGFDFAVDPDAVAFSRDSRLLAASSGHVIRVWDLSTGKPVGETNQAHLGHIRHIAYSPTGKLIATASEDGSARLWEAGTGKERFVLRHDLKVSTDFARFDWVLTSAFSPDGKLLATSSLDDTLRLWNTETGREIYKLAGHGRSGGHRAVGFSPDGRKLYSWGDDMYLRVWDVEKGRALLEHRVRPKGIDIPDDDDEESPRKDRMLKEKFIFFLANGVFIPGGESFALASRMRNVHFFSTADGAEQRIHDADASDTLAFSTNGKMMLSRSSGLDPSLALWNLPSAKMVAKIALPQSYGDVLFAGDGRSFAAALGPSIVVWETASAKTRLILSGYDDNARRLAFSADGRFLTAALDNSTALVWDLMHTAGTQARK